MAKSVAKVAVNICLTITLFWGNAIHGEELTCQECNLVLINLDFLRSDYVGLVDDSGLTPNINRFFRQSIIFENAYATAGSTYRGNLSVFTSTDPYYYAIDVVNFNRLARKNLGPIKNIFSARTSLFEILRTNNYFTFGLNKGYRSGSATFLDRGFDVYQDVPLRTLFEDLVPTIVKQVESEGHPKLVYLHAIPTRLHNAFYPQDRKRILSPHIVYRPYKMNDKDYGYAVRRRYFQGHEDMRAAEHAIYRQQLSYADDQLGLLFDALEVIASETIVVMFSTHGTQLGDKGIYASDGVGYESNIRVPLLIRHPSVELERRISQRVSLIDLSQTLLDMLNIKAPQSDGISLVPLIAGRLSAREYLWGKNDFDDFIIKGRWKLLRKFDYSRRLYRHDDLDKNNIFKENQKTARTIEFVEHPGVIKTRSINNETFSLEITENLKQLFLFDLEKDPNEIDNLAHSYPEIVDKLGNILNQHRLDADSRIKEALAN